MRGCTRGSERETNQRVQKLGRAISWEVNASGAEEEKGNILRIGLGPDRV